MTRPLTTTVAVVASGDTLSSVFPIRGRTIIVAPSGVTSCSIQFDIGTSPASASSFARAANVNVQPSSAAVWPLATGPGAFALASIAQGAPFARLVTSTPMTAPQSFTILQAS